MHNSTSIIVLLDAGLCVCKTGVAPIPGVVAGRSSLPRAMFVLFLSVCFVLVRPRKHGAAFRRCALYSFVYSPLRATLSQHSDRIQDVMMGAAGTTKTSITQIFRSIPLRWYDVTCLLHEGHTTLTCIMFGYNTMALPHCCTCARLPDTTWQLLL